MQLTYSCDVDESGECLKKIEECVQ